MTIQRDQVLFLHTNYPAQFRFLVKAYKSSNWDVWFASYTRRHQILPGIKYLKLNNGSNKGSKYDQQQRKSVISFQQLLLAKRNHGLNPKRIYIHTGWGLGSFLKELFPKALIFAYSEWWFNLYAEDYLFDPDNPNVNHDLNSKLFSLLRNQAFGYELFQADAIISPTKWQYLQLPKHFRAKTHIIFDGIDPNMFSPGIPSIELKNMLPNLDDNVPLLTYATRGLEPYRGFPEFIRAAIYLLQSEPNWHVAIAGNDSVNYHKSPKAPKNGYGSVAMEQFKSLGLEHRVHMLGSLPFSVYRDLLRRSTLHCYFTRPYVLSWSLLESALTGCRLLASNTKPVNEFLANEKGVTLVDYTSSKLGEKLVAISQKVIDEDISSWQWRKLRSSLVEKVSANKCVEQHFALAESIDGN